MYGDSRTWPISMAEVCNYMKKTCLQGFRVVQLQKMVRGLQASDLERRGIALSI